MDQLLAIRVFARVVECGSFTRAADSLSMPKTSVSKLVRELENHLGLRLLQRTTRRVTPTTDGLYYHELTSRLSTELDQIDQCVGSAQGTARGTIRVEVGGALATSLLIPALADFHARYPGIHLLLGVSNRPADLIGENIDCVIRGGPVGDESLAARRLGEMHLITCASTDYLRRHGEPRHPLDLKDHWLVDFHCPFSGRMAPPHFQRGDEHYDGKGHTAIGVNESNAHLAAAQAGLGIIQTFSYATQASVERGELVPLLTEWNPPPAPFHALYPPNRHLSLRVRVFIDWLVEFFAQHGARQSRGVRPNASVHTSPGAP